MLPLTEVMKDHELCRAKRMQKDIQDAEDELTHLKLACKDHPVSSKELLSEKEELQRKRIEAFENAKSRVALRPPRVKPRCSSPK
jgi:hypothetical protein